MSTDQPQPRPNPSSHTRTASFFSNFRKQSTTDNALQRSASANAEVPIQPRQSFQAEHRPTSPLQQEHQLQQQPQQQPQLQQPPAPPPLHPEIRSIVQLTVSHAHKIYFSGPLVRRVEREANGNKPAKDDGWTEVWAQLGGTTLSIWDMKQIQEASQQGKEVPPTYVNMMDAFVQVLGSVTVPATPTAPAQRYTNVLTLNTAGSNLLLFACQSTQALISWAAALRLSAWEKSRLEEIYTAHLIRITLSARDIPTTLIRGRLEGWVRIRIAGQTDWKLVWMVISAGADAPPGAPDELGRVSSNGGAPQQTGGRPTTMKRMSNLFGRDHGPQQNAGPSKPMITMYAGQKPRDRKKALLTMSDVTQAFAVYPERPELIQRSTLIKIEGTLGEEETAGSMRSREGWLLVMPQLEGNLSPAAEMLKWVIAFHDAFKLYGRPQAWTWDPRDPASLMFAYPVGPHKDLLFLEREQAETLDPRDDRTSAIRSNLLNILTTKMRDQQGPATQQEPVRAPDVPSLPPLRSGSGNAGPQLPPLSFDSEKRPVEYRDRELLTPITERSSVFTHGRPGSIEANSVLAKPGTSPVPEESSPLSILDENKGILDQPFSTSPKSTGRSLQHEGNGHVELVPPTPQKDARFSPPISRRSAESGSVPRTGPSPSLSLSRSSIDRNDSFSHAVHTALPPSAPMSPQPQDIPARPHSPRSILTSPFSVVETDRASIAAQSLSDSQNLNQSNQSTYSSSLGVGTAGSSGIPRDRTSVLTSPYSPMSSPKQAPSVFPASSRASNDDHALSNEAGALFYMQQFGDNAGPSTSPPATRRMPSTIKEDDDSDSDEDKPRPTSRDRMTPVGSSSLYSSKDSASLNNKSPVVRQGTPMAFANVPTSGGSPVPEDRMNPSSSRNLGRKPSGARAQAQATNSRFTGTEVASNNLVSQKLSEEDVETDEDDDDGMDTPASATSPAAMTRPLQPPVDDDSLDAYAAFSYLDINDTAAPSSTTTTTTKTNVPQQPTPPAQSIPKVNLPPSSSGSGSGEPAVYKSSFAPSKQAAERKAKVQAQQAAQAAAAHRPGRANGKKKRPVSTQAGAWQESSDEEEEDEEEDDDDDEDVDSDGEPQSKPASGGNSSSNSFKPQGEDLNGDHQQGGDMYSHLRPPRTLPLPPGGRATGADGDEQFPRRPSASQYPESRRTYFDDGTQLRTQAEHPMPGAARQTIWSQVLDPGHTPGAVPEQSNAKDTFVQIEPPSQTMTKAFTPQGLLSAGMQDRQDRSAKRQEELARESGASLINVPNKPPPPQTGLLGAVSAHERERKREGGLGAALTEREREKRVAEERQRKFDEQQRQQMEQMQQGGSMYGGYPGFNPMMMGMNPMMMGMNPMMTGGGMGPMNPMMSGNGMPGMGGLTPMMTGFSGMMPGGYNPQHMFAAQQAAAQAYQQAMMAFSTAGSQAGGDGGNGNSPGGGSPPMNPMMTGSMYDPRMSMMGMPMMGMGGMGMGMGGGMGGMGMQMTGMSQFDPRATPQGGSPSGMNDPNGLLPPNGLASGGGSPARRGSPLARPPTNGEGARSPSRPASPKS